MYIYIYIYTHNYTYIYIYTYYNTQYIIVTQFDVMQHTSPPRLGCDAPDEIGPAWQCIYRLVHMCIHMCVCVCFCVSIYKCLYINT